MLASKKALQGFIKILQNVPAIRNLHRVRRAIRDSFGVSARSIPSDDFDPRVSFEPLGKCGLFAIRQQLNGAAALKVNQNRPVTSSTAKGEVINPKHARSRGPLHSGLSN
jgi:hypothetical protein